MVPRRWGARFASSAAALACAACAALSADPLVSWRPLEGTDGKMHAVPPTGPNRITVLIFFVVGCRHLEVHDARLRALAQKYSPLGVSFFAVDSDMHGSMDIDRSAAIRHGYPFPILRDAGGRLAQRLAARHAGYAVIIERDGSVHYRGAIDSDRFHLHDDATPFLADALSDLLSGREPRRVETESFGCALEP